MNEKCLNDEEKNTYNQFVIINEAKKCFLMIEFIPLINLVVMTKRERERKKKWIANERARNIKRLQNVMYQDFR